LPLAFTNDRVHETHKHSQKANQLSFIHLPIHTHPQEAAAVKAAQVQVLAASKAAAAIISAAEIAATHARAAADVAAIGAQTPDTTLAIKNEVERVRLAVAAEVERVRIVIAATAATAAGTYLYIFHVPFDCTHTHTQFFEGPYYIHNECRACKHAHMHVCISDLINHKYIGNIATTAGSDANAVAAAATAVANTATTSATTIATEILRLKVVDSLFRFRLILNSSAITARVKISGGKTGGSGCRSARGKRLGRRHRTCQSRGSLVSVQCGSCCFSNHIETSPGHFWGSIRRSSSNINSRART